MKRSEYIGRLREAFAEDRISEEAFWAALDNADIFCDEDEDEEHFDDDRLPDGYAEIEYDDFDDPEAILGARFDDMNYLRYRER